MSLADRDYPLHPSKERTPAAALGLDVHRLVAVDRIHYGREIQGGGLGSREAGVAVAGPLHRCAYRVPVAEEDVVAHPDLVAVVDDRGAGHAHEEAVEELYARPVVLHHRGEAPPDAHVYP